MEATEQTDSQKPIVFIDYFKTLEMFNQYARHDKRLTPAIQLVYRILLETGNRQYWADPISCSDAWIMELTGYSKQTITEAKRTLKNLNFIDFHGKPTKYHLYSLVGNQVGNRVGHSETPSPRTPYPRVKTTNRKTKPKKENQKKERCEGNDSTDLQHSGRPSWLVDADDIIDI